MRSRRRSIIGCSLGTGLWLAVACVLPEAARVDAVGAGGAAPTGTADLVVGWANACTVVDSGDAYCWGDNSYGAVGNGEPVTAWKAAKVQGLDARVVQLVAGFQFHCALLEPARVACWGRNAAGAFGIAGDTAYPVAIDVPDLSGALELAAGYGYLCARMPDGGVQCMGAGARGSTGQPGADVSEPRAVPLDTTGLGAVTALASASGSSIVCALDAARQLACWGAGVEPARVSAEPVVAVSVGVGPSSLDDGGAIEKILYATADGGRYATPSGSVWAAAQPVDLPADVTQLSLGTAEWCGRDTSGAVFCGGYAGSGTPEAATSFDALDAFASADIGLGADFGCSRDTAGPTRCWGANGAGQIGNEKPTEIYAPVAVPGVTGAKRVFVGHASTAAVVDLAPPAVGTSIFAWGTTAAFALERALSTEVYPAGGEGVGWVSFDHGDEMTAELDEHAYLVRGASTLRWLDHGTEVATPVLAPAAEPFLQAYGAHGIFEVGLRPGGAAEVVFHVNVAASGMNDHGLLGDGTMDAPGVGLRTLDVPGTASVLAFRRESGHMCALAGTTVHCWGGNGAGQIGNGTQSDMFAPYVVLDPAVDVCVGAAHTCAVDPTNGGAVRCWGSNAEGQLGLGNAPGAITPTAVPMSLQPNRVVCGLAHTCAFRVNGSAQCWGSNAVGQLGVGDKAQRNQPTELPLQDVVDMSAGTYHTCAVTGGGAVHCWGAADFGQVGNGTVDSHYPVPELVVGIGN
ncbi:MAG: hypothetical protein HY908_29540 [Myxococcales bacterium]|nr:hypothetical protein [Myxococcales bacterium]